MREQRVWTDGDVGYVEILSKHGRFVGKFDADRAPLIQSRRWCVAGRYALSSGTKANSPALMHQFLFPDCPEGMVRDHINHDGFDNRSENVRFVSKSHNAIHQRNRKYPAGVRKMGNGRFRASVSLGTSFATPEEAHEVWKMAYEKLNGALPDCVAP